MKKIKIQKSTDPTQKIVVEIDDFEFGLKDKLRQAKVLCNLLISDISGRVCEEVFKFAREYEDKKLYLDENFKKYFRNRARQIKKEREKS